MKLYGKNDQIIKCLDDWKSNIRKNHWKEGRSAMELAKAWLAKPGKLQIPDELQVLLKSYPQLSVPNLNIGRIEVLTKIDEFKGGQRNHDMVLINSQSNIEAVVCVEAKADEPFNGTVEVILKNARKSPKSNKIKRISRLAARISNIGLADINHIQYQLLHAVAGTYAEAFSKKVKTAIFVIHEFHSPCNANKFKKNCSALDGFLTMLSGENVHLNYGRLIGPFRAYGPDDKFYTSDIELYIGKCKRPADTVNEFALNARHDG